MTPVLQLLHPTGLFYSLKPHLLAGCPMAGSRYQLGAGVPIERLASGWLRELGKQRPPGSPE
jgi:hypothetical protein